MPSLRAIRDRLDAVLNIQKVTSAMELIASSRLHRAQAKAIRIRAYLMAMKTLLAKVSRSSDLAMQLGKKQVKKTGVIIVSSDRGLCGSYNNAIFHAADQFLKSYEAGAVELILFGRKASQLYRHRPYKIREEILDWGGKLPFEKIDQLSDEWFRLFQVDALDEIWLIYTHFVSILTRQVTIERFLPLARLEDEGMSLKMEYIFETNPAQIYTELLPRYLSSKVQSVLNEAYASELAARALAMKSATHNAEEKIGDLTQLRNKVRQEGITREMIEITTGASRA